MPDHVLAGLDIDQRTERWKATLTEVNDAAVLLAVRQLGGPFEELGAFCMVGPVRDLLPQRGPRLTSARCTGTGAGRAAHDAGVAHCWAAGDYQLVMWVLTGNNRARSFYARNGWVCDQLTERHVHGGNSMPVSRYSLARPLQQP
jgi:hypothetical protein